ncbi:MAG TPA: ATP phosphoribosyltransferase regulatory subunit, partial [Geobacterales bacterium]|nr:ATP phosphoribosyltransferase regulatory subunit [Geobacterales bacterium]
TPLLEYQDVLAIGLGEELKGKTFRFDDRLSGKLLVIPPDITPQIARIVATRMSSYPLPHRIYYSGRVLRQAESQSGRSREILQAGVELIGLESAEADAEMVAMAVAVLKDLGLTDFKIDLGHVDFVRGVLEGVPLTPAAAGRLREAVGKKDTAAVRAILEQENLPLACRDEIAALTRLFGGREVLAEAARMVTNDLSRRALANLTQVLEFLDIHGVSEHLTFDLGEIRGLDYHTGMTFEGFVPGMGEPVCGGGRYDTLTARYGFPAPATGFAFNILSLLGALEQRPDLEAAKTRDFLLFNRREDKREVLAIAQLLRQQGYTTARDIIRRDFDNSLAYARRMNIRLMMVIGDDHCADNEVYVVRVADGHGKAIKKEQLQQTNFHGLFDVI